MSKRQPITAAEWLYILLLLSPLLEEISQAQEQGLRIWWRSSRNRVDAVVLVALVSGCVLRVLLARSVIYRLAGAAIVSIAIVSIAIVNIAIVSIAIVSVAIVSLRSSTSSSSSSSAPSLTMVILTMVILTMVILLWQAPSSSSSAPSKRKVCSTPAK